MDPSIELNEEIQNVVKNYGPSIYRLAFTYLKNRADAEDVAQEVLVAYIRKSPVFVTEEKRRNWLMKVTGNKCKNLSKSAWRKNTVTLGKDIGFLPEESYGIISYVLSLDEKYRIPIHLFYYEGYSINEIAGLLHSNPATVGTWLARGRALLKTMMGGDFCG